jgi:flavorubredoxin
MTLQKDMDIKTAVDSARGDDLPLKICEDIFWVGMYDKSGTHSNSYLIVDKTEALLIDGGSRLNFPSVVMKILKTGMAPSAIVALCYQNYNPRFCGSLHHFDLIINRPDLKIISDRASLMFIEHYLEADRFLSLDEASYRFEFSSGRLIDFIKTPFAHSAGSFVTFDRKSGVLFTGDLFSSYSCNPDLMMKLTAKCGSCEAPSHCIDEGKPCPLFEIAQFHRNMMTSERALKYALEQIASVPFTIIAPQHGSVIRETGDIILVSDILAKLQRVGIDSIVGDRSFADMGNISPMRERLGAALRKTAPRN